MSNVLIASYDGRKQPGINQVAVYWPLAWVTNVYEEEGFVFDAEPDTFGSDTDYPELIEFDYKAATHNLLNVLMSINAAADHPYRQVADQAIKAARGF